MYHEELSLPFLQQPLFLTSKRIHRQHKHRQRPYHPSAQQKLHQRLLVQVHLLLSWISMYRPGKGYLIRNSVTVTTKIELTRQEPPPRFSFHHLVFKICNLPSSCNFKTAPLIAVRYGESKKKYFKKTKKKKQFQKKLTRRHCYSITFWIQHSTNLCQFTISFNYILNCCGLHKKSIASFTFDYSLNSLEITWCENCRSSWLHERPHSLIGWKVWVL